MNTHTHILSLCLSLSQHEKNFTIKFWVCKLTKVSSWACILTKVSSWVCKLAKVRSWVCKLTKVSSWVEESPFYFPQNKLESNI